MISARGNHSGRVSAALCGAALILLALVLPATAAADGEAQASIINGHGATIEEFPSLAYIEAHQGNSGFACTGTVASPRVILTAAHCVEDIERGIFTPAGQYAVATGTTTIGKALRENVFKVVETHVFPGFDPGSLRGDAAILVLDRPTPAPPIALAGPTDAALYGGGATLQLAGWGLTKADARNGPETLRATTLTIQSPTSCGTLTRRIYPQFSAATQFCALDAPAKKSGGCFGDSGGPGIGQRADGTPVELGIISTGGPFCNTRFPNVLTRVDTVSGWVGEWIAATEAGAPRPVANPALPQMTRSVAELFAVYTLQNHFGRAFERAAEVFGNCRRAGRSSYRCELAFRSGRNLYAGIVTPAYVRRQDAVAWQSHFRIEWAAIKCLRKNPNRCAIHTRRG
ncbi:MAG TPA: serine protease [Solirubrobacterales bacterium]|nr:serine protease [Solirubrobacterales bacterium]